MSQAFQMAQFQALFIASIYASDSSDFKLNKSTLSDPNSVLKFSSLLVISPSTKIFVII